MFTSDTVQNILRGFVDIYLLHTLRSIDNQDLIVKTKEQEIKPFWTIQVYVYIQGDRREIDAFKMNSTQIFVTEHLILIHTNACLYFSFEINYYF